MARMPPPDGHLIGLDPLRAAAATAVLLFHVIYSGAWDAFPASGPFAWLRGGWIGVDIFFVISGLVVGGSALQRHASQPQAMRRRFLRDRMARILPLYLLTSIVFLGLSPAFFSRPDLGWQLLSHALFLHNLWPETATSINMPSWSLAAEVQLYVVMACLISVIRRQHPLLIAAAGLLLSLGYRAAIVLLIAPAAGWNDADLQHAVYLTPGMLESFALGVAIARWRQSGLPAWPRALTPVLLIAGLGGLALAAQATPAVIDGTIWQSPCWAISMRSLIALAAAALVLACMRLSLSAQGLSARVLRHAGELSYGLYLWHHLLMQLALGWLPLRGGALFAFVLAASALLAELSLRWVERPGQSWLRSRCERAGHG